jgi:hypothetical protein
MNFTPNSFTGDFTSMEVPSGKTVTRPSWSVPLDQVIAGITGKIDNITSTQGLASVDPYCEWSPAVEMKYLPFESSYQIQQLTSPLRLLRLSIPKSPIRPSTLATLTGIPFPATPRFTSR